MTEEIIIDGVNVAGCVRLQDDKISCDLGGECKGWDNCYYKQLIRLEQERDELKKTVENQKLEHEELQCDLSEVENACGCYQSENAELKQENKSLYEEKNCLHKIIDRLLENAGYSKDIASAEDFEDVYEDMQRKINELAELEQENKDLKELNKKICEDWEKEIKVYGNALEEIREINKLFFERKYGYPEDLIEIENIINEVLNLS